MKRILLPAILLILMNCHFDVMAEQKEVHNHDHDVSQQKIELNHGEKWTIDESLHVGMTAIKEAITNSLEDIHYDRFSLQQYTQLAIGLDKHLAYLFEHCKLPPKADAQLHVLLAQIMQGASEMKHDTDQKQGAILVIKALKDYPTYFNDPAWQALVH